MQPRSDSAEATTVADLVRRIAGGERDAETDLVMRFSRGLSYMLRRLAGDPALAEDLHQETFRVVIEKIRRGDVREPEKINGFIRTTAKNLLHTGKRKSERRGDEALESLPEPLTAEPGPDERLALHEKATLVRRVLGEMKHDRDREILFRFYLAEQDKSHICRELNLDSLNFNRVLHKARNRFKELVLNYFGDG